MPLLLPDSPERAPSLSNPATFEPDNSAMLAWFKLLVDTMQDKSVLIATDIMGTVTQGGSKIIQRGSNSNGEFMRLADGTQICTRTATFDTNNTSSVQTAAMPATFASGIIAASVSLQESDLGGSGFLGRMRAAKEIVIGASTTNFAARFETALGEGSITFRLLAIGRWF